MLREFNKLQELYEKRKQLEESLVEADSKKKFHRIVESISKLNQEINKIKSQMTKKNKMSSTTSNASMVTARDENEQTASNSPINPNHADCEEFLSRCVGLTANDIAQTAFEYREVFVYQGFDPENMAKVLVKACKNNLAAVKSNIIIAVVTLVERGTKLKRIADKSNVSYQRRLNVLKAILTTNTNKKLTRNDITIQRIAAIVPEFTAYVVDKFNRQILPGFDNVPPIVRSMFLAPILPSHGDYVTVAKVNMLYHRDFEALVRPKNPTSQEVLATYWTASHGSKLLCENSRKALCDKLGVTPTCCDGFAQLNMARLNAINCPRFAPPVIEEVNLGSLGIPSSLDLNCTQRGRPANTLEQANREIGVAPLPRSED